jgi:hypothetical protein
MSFVSVSKHNFICKKNLQVFGIEYELSNIFNAENLFMKLLWSFKLDSFGYNSNDNIHWGKKKINDINHIFTIKYYINFVNRMTIIISSENIDLLYIYIKDLLIPPPKIKTFQRIKTIKKVRFTI